MTSKLPNIDNRFNQPVNGVQSICTSTTEIIHVPSTIYPEIIVDEQTDGLVDQAVYTVINDVLDNVDINVPKLKVYPGIDGYWCYLKSFGDYVSIDNSVDGEISLELNESKLYTTMSLGICPGETGPFGNIGKTGSKGVMAPIEPFYNPINELFVVYVPIPIGTYIRNNVISNISIRLFRSLSPDESGISGYNYWNSLIQSRYTPIDEVLRFESLTTYIEKQLQGIVGEYGIVELSTVSLSNIVEPTPIAEIHLNWSTGAFELISNDLNLTIDNINIRVLYEIGTIEISFGSLDISNIVIKARQLGRDGERGDAPSDTVNIIECVFDQTNVRPNGSLLNLRTDCDNRIIYTEYGRVPNQESYARISPTPNLSTSNIQVQRDGRYLSVPVSTNDNRRTASTSISEITKNRNMIVPRSLILPSFVPEAGCPAKNHEGEYDFDWIPSTDIPPCDEKLKWFGVGGIKSGLYPFEILKKQQSDESTEDPNNCCQDDFYYFPDYNC